MNPILLLDTTYLCHRAWHAIKGLSYEDRGVGAIFGVLRDVVTLQDEFCTTRCVFAFDAVVSHRYAMFPAYKSSRASRMALATVEERAARLDFGMQVRDLCNRYLPAAGFRNVFCYPGFEADDVLAAIAAALPSNVEGVIISSDHDLWQCLRPNVWCWNPNQKRGYTLEQFRAEWGLEPRQWAAVKAYAGCQTDDVPGVQGVGEATAARWLRGDLGGHTKAAQKLEAATKVYRRNLDLVSLPFPGTPTPVLEQDEVTAERWNKLAKRLGMTSLVGHPPRVAVRTSRGRKRRERGVGFGLV